MATLTDRKVDYKNKNDFPLMQISFPYCTATSGLGPPSFERFAMVNEPSIRPGLSWAHISYLCFHLATTKNEYKNKYPTVTDLAELSSEFDFEDASSS